MLNYECSVNKSLKILAVLFSHGYVNIAIEYDSVSFNHFNPIEIDNKGSVYSHKFFLW